MAAGQNMEGAQTSRGKEGTQELNTEHSTAKDLLTKSSADGDSTATTKG